MDPALVVIRSYFFREYVAHITCPLTWTIARNLHKAAHAKARWHIRNMHR